MNKTIISWTNKTWNPTHGCSKVSDGCKYCYAMTLSLRYGWTKQPWTIQNEKKNVIMKPHKLVEPYKLKEPQRVFVNSMSDLFHAQIPDWYRAVIFCVMLDNDQHVFQVLTKRPELTIEWQANFMKAIASKDFADFAANAHPRIQAACRRPWSSPWGANIWMGTSVEDHRVTGRIDQLRQCGASVRFVSAEPLIGSWGGPITLEGIHWVIVGGESGTHMKPGNPRWIKQEWAIAIKDQCLSQGVAYFYKQDSGGRTELRPWLVENGQRWKWCQYPGDFTDPVNLDEPELEEDPHEKESQLPLFSDA